MRKVGFILQVSIVAALHGLLISSSAIAQAPAPLNIEVSEEMYPVVDAMSPEKIGAFARAIVRWANAARRGPSDDPEIETAASSMRELCRECGFELDLDTWLVSVKAKRFRGRAKLPSNTVLSGFSPSAVEPVKMETSCAPGKALIDGKCK